MSEESKKKNLSEIISKKKEKKQEELIKYDKLKTQLIEKEYKDNLKDVMEQRLFDFKNKLMLLDRDRSLSAIQIENLIRGKSIYGRSMVYSSDELAFLFDYYKEFISEINKVTRFVPTKPNFCGFIGMTTDTYDEYLCNREQSKREVMKMIDDYIIGIQLSLAQSKEIDNVTTIFRGKTEHKMVEASAPIVIKSERTVDIEEMNRQIEALKAGKSLKTIELSKKEYETEEET